MDIQTVISIIGLIGLGGILGSYFQHLFNKRREISLEIRRINEERYRSTLVWMRIFLKPENLHHFNINEPNFTNKNNDKIKEYAKQKIVEYYYNGFLYASDEVLKRIKNFLKEPNGSNFIKTAFSMRKDLWNKS